MEWIQATPRPCHHHRFPIRLVRRPPPSGTPPSLEQTSQPQTTLMNWRYHPPHRVSFFARRAYKTSNLEAIQHKQIDVFGHSHSKGETLASPVDWNVADSRVNGFAGGTR